MTFDEFHETFQDLDPTAAFQQYGAIARHCLELAGGWEHVKSPPEPGWYFVTGVIDDDDDESVPDGYVARYLVAIQWDSVDWSDETGYWADGWVRVPSDLDVSEFLP